jgi:putative tryptophan/tyrosine transport system substrate-binding protein
MAIRVGRRKFLAALGGAAAWPLAARAQQTKLPALGLLHSGSPGPSARNLMAFHKGLAETGYVEGRNVAIEYRFAEGRLDRLPMLAAELVRREVTVLAAIGGFDAARAAKDATTTIPIVFNIGNDPVQTGLVASLSRPGGNVTGVTQLSREVQGKRLAMARELLPNASLMATFTNPASVVADFNLRDLQAAAAGAGQRLLVLAAGSDSELDAAFVEIARQDVGALFINGNPFFSNSRELVVTLAARHRIPTIFPNSEFVEAGGLMSYGTSLEDLYRLAGNYTGRLLRGEKPADLPVQQPTKFELVINLKTAKALGLMVPLTLQYAADEVIE